MSDLNELSFGEIEDLGLEDLADDKPAVAAEAVPGAKPYVEPMAIVYKPASPVPGMFDQTAGPVAQAGMSPKKVLLTIGIIGGVFYLASAIFGGRRPSAGRVRLSGIRDLLGDGLSGKKARKGKKGGTAAKAPTDGRVGRTTTVFSLAGNRELTVYTRSSKE